jgi:hypothetical protein
LKPIKQFAQELSDAYSTTRYRGGWAGCIRMLRRRRYNDTEIEAIIRSKHTRWAGDASDRPDRPYGKLTSTDLAKYIDNYKDFADEVEDLVRGTFES